MRDALEEYLEQEGHEPPEAPDEYAWQWAYTGKPAEKEKLEELLGLKHARLEEATLF